MPAVQVTRIGKLSRPLHMLVGVDVKPFSQLLQVVENVVETEVVQISEVARRRKRQPVDKFSSGPAP